MRKIKFRGINKNGHWVYGNMVCMHGLGDTWVKGIQMIAEGDRAWGSIEVNSNTIGEYTGLEDKKGKEIYEGDLIKVDDEHLYVICFRAQDSGYIGSNEYGHDEQDLYYLACNYEVIGNIYENPGLLK